MSRPRADDALCRATVGQDAVNLVAANGQHIGDALKHVNDFTIVHLVNLRGLRGLYDLREHSALHYTLLLR